jgi:type IV pilus assembly protein PilE
MASNEIGDEMKKIQAGFTLIELMIAVIVVGILFGVAIPSYQNSVRKTDRSEAKSELATVAGRLQSCYSTYGQYNNDLCGVYKAMKDGEITSSGSGFYSVDFATASAITTTSYTLTAKAIKLPQTKDTGCTEMTLSHTGVKAPATCW